jgi:hypothetical protein
MVGALETRETPYRAPQLLPDIIPASFKDDMLKPPQFLMDALEAKRRWESGEPDASVASKVSS